MEIPDALILSISGIGLWVLLIILWLYHNRLDRMDAAKKEIEKAGSELPPYHIHPPMYEVNDYEIINIPSIPNIAVTRN